MRFGLVASFLLIVIALPASAQVLPLPPVGDVDVIYQTNGYVPAFYQGKAVRADMNSMTFMAIATKSDGTVLNPKDVKFTWGKDGTIFADRSGEGVNTFTYDGIGISRPFTISVEVLSSDQSVRTKKTVTVNKGAPEVLLYEDNPLYGIEFQKALRGGVALEGKEMNIAAFPFFFNVTARNDQKLSYAWAMNGVAVSDVPGPSLLLRQTSTSAGSSAISLIVSNAKEFLQSAQANMTLTFSGTSQTTTF